MYDFVNKRLNFYTDNVEETAQNLRDNISKNDKLLSTSRNTTHSKLLQLSFIVILMCLIIFALVVNNYTLQYICFCVFVILIVITRGNIML